MLIYPPLKHKTDSKTIFFIGSAREFCRINDQEIELVYNGNFCPVLDLEPGENIFKLNIDGLCTEVLIESIQDTVVKDDYKFEAFDVDIDDARLKPSKICIDPGHGGTARGTCSPKGLTEKELNLSLSLKIQDALLNKGFEVFLTRNEDRDISLKERVACSEAFAADLLLSIHHNAIPDHLNPQEHHGISAHYYYEHSKKLASDMSESLAKALALKNNGAIQQNLYITRENKHSKAILLECGYLIHPKESEEITTEAHQVKLAAKLVDFLSSL